MSKTSKESKGAFAKAFDIAGLWARFFHHTHEASNAMRELATARAAEPPDLDTAIVERQRLLAAADELAAQAKTYDPIVLEGVLERGLGMGNGTYRGVPGLWVNVEQRTTRTLDAKKLLDAGVSSEVIAACTITRTSDPYVKIGAAKEKE